ncbi:MAG: hypothetical protein R2712_29930 [Vicinamibacterales bacterium]
MRQITAVLAVAAVSAAAALAQAPTPPMKTRPETRALVVADLARSAHVAEDAIEMVKEEDRVWPDANLGCPERKGLLEPVPVDGYAFTLKVDGRQVEYHTDRQGRIKACPPAKPRVQP